MRKAEWQEEFLQGPSSVLVKSVQMNTQVLILLNRRNNNRLLGKIKAFDEDWNMVLENVKETWTEVPNAVKGKAAATPVNKERFISKMFLPGESVMLVLSPE